MEVSARVLRALSRLGTALVISVSMGVFPVRAAELGPPSFDGIILVDNTLSMRSSDAQGGVRKAIAQFIKSMPAGSRIGMGMYDESMETLVPIQAVNPSVFVQALKRLNYKGRYSNLPAALEHAAYDLKARGRPDAVKGVILLTDGGVDTGEAARDQSSINWLTNQFVQDAKSHAVAIYAVALSNKADFQLLHVLSTSTLGDYSRAYRGDDLLAAVKHIRDLIVERVVERGRPAPTVRSAPPPSGEVAGDEPNETTASAVGKALASPMGLVLLTVCAGFVAYLAGHKPVVRGSGHDDDDANFAMWRHDLCELVPPAHLRPMTGDLAPGPVRLDKPYTVVGRVAPLPNSKVGHLRLEDQSIGRCHALIEYRERTFWIVDKKSLNGTFVNGQRVNGERRLQHGDRVRFHTREFEFVLPELEIGDDTIALPQLAHEPELGTDSPHPAADVDVPVSPSSQSRVGEDSFAGDDDQSITRLLSQLNEGPIIDPEIVGDRASTAGSRKTSLQATNSELDSLIKSYMDEPSLPAAGNGGNPSRRDT